MVLGTDCPGVKHSEVREFYDQYGENSEVCGFTNKFGEHLPSVWLGHISGFPPAQDCLSRAMLLGP